MAARPLAPQAPSPGVYFSVHPPAPEPSPLRTDVAGVIACTRRGPLQPDSRQGALAVRVRGLRECEHLFGELEGACGQAVRGYFENGGELLWVVRVAGAPATASCQVDVSAARGALGSLPPSPALPQSARLLTLRAASPGSWANTLQVRLQLRRSAPPRGEPAVDVLVLQGGQVREHLLGLEARSLVQQVAARSSLIRLEIHEPTGEPPGQPPRLLERWGRLEGGGEQPPGLEEYHRAAQALAVLPEPALLFAPEARQHLGVQADSFYAEWAAAAAASLDRLVLVDPPAEGSAQALARCAEALAEGPGAGAAALYYPQLKVAAARGLSVSATWPVPPSGHVAGLISRMDRERGAHHTPANAPLQGAVALVGELDEVERVGLYRLGLNPLHCTRGRGLEVWGGRTLHSAPARRFVAHVRMVHRLVRAMRRAAEPLVFDSNTPLLRLALVRALTSVLLEAFRSGALKGTRPEQAFRVRCNNSTHPPGAYEQGLCIAEVSLALAAPMEFIHLTVALSQDGSLKVLE